MAGVFSVFFTQTTFSEKRFILFISVLYAILCPGLIGIAVWFKEPSLLCVAKNDVNGTVFPCSQNIACKNEYNFTISENSSESLSKNLEIICERKGLKRGFLSSYFFGGVLGCLTNTFIYVPARFRKTVLSTLGIIHGIANFGILFSFGNIAFMAMSFGLLSFTWIIIHAYCFMSMNEAFSGDTTKSSIVIMMLTWGAFGVGFSGWSYIIDANYYLIFFVNGCIAIGDSVFLFLFKLDRELKVLAKTPKNICGFLKQLWPFKQIRYNILTYVIVWSAFCVTYNDVFIKLETVGGNLFVNMAIISLFEMSASFISGIISMKFDIFKTMKNLMTIEIILGALFLLAPIHVKQDMPLNQAVLLLIVLIFTKFFSDVINNLINLYGPKVFTDDFMGIFFTMSRLFSRIFLFCLPTINYYFELAGVHPFIFLSMLWLLCKVMTHQTAEIQEEGIADVLNEFKVDMVTRVSVIHNSQNLHDIDDVLDHVTTQDNRRVSEVRKSRLSARRISKASSTNEELELGEVLLNKSSKK